MENTSPFLAMQRAETLLKGMLRTIDIDLLTPDERKAAASLRRFAHEARLDIRDYELSETRPAQLKKAHQSQEMLKKIQMRILDLDAVFGPADIAQLDALLEQINGWIE
jgi:hypothetical protein